MLICFYGEPLRNQGLKTTIGYGFCDLTYNKLLQQSITERYFNSDTARAKVKTSSEDENPPPLFSTIFFLTPGLPYQI